MKINEPVTQREYRLTEQETIISTTNLKGITTSINEDFLRITGFPESELVGHPHNVVRHPDMPPEVFRDLWGTLKSKRPWMGLVKNRCKNGDHYFVNAYVTPIYDDDVVVGYQSVRFRSEQAIVDRAMALYKNIREKKSNVFERLKPQNLSFLIKSWIVALVVTLPSIGFALAGGATVQWLAVGGTFIVAAGLVLGLSKPLIRLASQSRDLFDSATACHVYTGRTDEVGQLALVIKALQMQNRTILGRVEYSSEVLSEVATETKDIVEKTTEGIQRQQMEVEQIATAMNEMVATVAEVARNAEQTAKSSEAVLAKANDGEQLAKEAISDISLLSAAVGDATSVLEKLTEDSQNIGSVVDVISSIASKTNLLALNAAIEAARAGEQGRGFAVVADEVRNLASNTQHSTDEIQQMIQAIQQSSNSAMEAMDEGKKCAEQSVEQAERVGRAFGDISAAVDRISHMNVQVATASEQQSAVTEEVSRNVVAINDAAYDTLNNANHTAEASKRLSLLVGNLQSMVKQFGSI